MCGKPNRPASVRRSQPQITGIGENHLVPEDIRKTQKLRLRHGLPCRQEGNQSGEQYQSFNETVRHRFFSLDEYDAWGKGGVSMSVQSQKHPGPGMNTVPE